VVTSSVVGSEVVGASVVGTEVVGVGVVGTVVVGAEVVPGVVGAGVVGSEVVPGVVGAGVVGSEVVVGSVVPGAVVVGLSLLHDAMISNGAASISSTRTKQRALVLILFISVRLVMYWGKAKKIRPRLRIHFNTIAETCQGDWYHLCKSPKNGAHFGKYTGAALSFIIKHLNIRRNY